MKRLYNEAIQELEEIAEQTGLTYSNLEEVEKLSTIAKNLAKITKKTYQEEPYYEKPLRKRSYLDNKLETLTEYTEKYEHDKKHAETDRITFGLEKMMEAMVCFVEEIYNFAETAEEKEIIHKHIQKIKTM